MSRIGNRILQVPSDINVEFQAKSVLLKKGNEVLEVIYPSNLIKVVFENNELKVLRKDETKQSNMHQGTVNANLSNAIIGLSKGFLIELEIKGVGYKAKLEGNNLNLALGFSHPVILPIPKGIKVEVPSQTEIKLTSADKAKVGEFAANIRKYRAPEPYKGKGILYKGEQIVRKVGKTADKKK